MDLLSELKIVEENWLTVLNNTCRNNFKQINLPSHNEDHHYRVWLNAKELLMELNNISVKFNRSDITKILMASFFHDTGMSVNIDKSHGHESKKICERFLKENNPSEINNAGELLDVIENHDEKEYKNQFAVSNDQKNLFKILSICDDLDAFGITGAYRYIEIYLQRDIQIEDIASQVLKNLTGRMNYFTKSFGYLEIFHDKHIKRAYLTKKFFTDLNNQIFKSPANSLEGPAGIVNFINHYIIKEKMKPVEASEIILEKTSDIYVKKFFRDLIFELKCNCNIIASA